MHTSYSPIIRNMVTSRARFLLLKVICTHTKQMSMCEISSTTNKLSAYAVRNHLFDITALEFMKNCHTKGAGYFKVRES